MRGRVDCKHREEMVTEYGEEDEEQGEVTIHYFGYLHVCLSTCDCPVAQ